MPIIQSAKKKMRADARKRVHNLRRKLTLRQALKIARRTPTPESLRAAQKALDKAAKTNVIHHNKAARLQSRLVKYHPSA